MIGIFDRLMAGESELPAQFAAAKAYWLKFYAEHRSATAEQIAKDLGLAQMHIERIFGGDRDLGKTAMPITAIGALWDDSSDGLGERKAFAKRVANAFERSSVSIEVKSSADRARQLYGVDDM